MGQVRVVVTRIAHNGAMQRRMVDTARQGDPRNWEDLAARAPAAPVPYRPVPGTAIYLICVNGRTVQVCEYDLEGPLRDLVTVVVAIGSQMLAAPAGRPGQAGQINPICAQRIAMPIEQVRHADKADPLVKRRAARLSSVGVALPGGGISSRAPMSCG